MKGVMTIFRNVRSNEPAAAFRACYKRYCSTENFTKQKKHPYFQIHPWKSENEFAKDLLKNIVYNSDGIIAINKPFGISLQNTIPNSSHVQLSHKIVGEVNYSVQDVLPYLAKELDVPILIPCLGAEKYVSGIYVFGINNKVCEQIDLARKRTQGPYRKYWAVTIKVPHEIKGSYHLAMVLKTSVLGDKKPILLSKWSKNAEKRNEVKILNVNYKVLSNSTYNLSSLVEIEISTRRWNSLRLFASTMLYSPVLGDNVHGSRVQEFMGTYLKVDPFAESCWNLPKLNRQLLDLLNVTPKQQEIIPAHIHLRNVRLCYGKEKKNIIIEAPLMDPFDWTCKQLKFKMPDEARNTVINNEEEVACI